jgi:hypothetical protein
MSKRKLSEDEIRVYTNNLERNLEEKKILDFNIRMNTLRFEIGNELEFKQEQKKTKLMLERDISDLEKYEFAIKDCREKIEAGEVEIKEE